MIRHSISTRRSYAGEVPTKINESKQTVFKLSSPKSSEIFRRSRRIPLRKVHRSSARTAASWPRPTPRRWCVRIILAAGHEDEISYWDGRGSRGEPRIVIDLDQQRAYFYKGDQMVGVSVVSTGREGYDTLPGEFRITEKDRRHVSSLYGDYVDQSGQVVMENVEADKDPPGNNLPGSGHAILPQNSWWHRHARRLSAGLSGVTWLYSVARENGSSIF